jgi:hypothetical protein
MLGIPLRYLLMPSIIAVADLATDPLEVWKTIHDAYVAERRRRNLNARLWFFWLLTSMAVGGTIGTWLSGDALSISFGIIVGGLTFTSLRLWRKGFD